MSSARRSRHALEVEFTEDSAVQPDILVILDPQRDRLTAARLYGPVASLPALTIDLDELFHVVWTGLESGPW